MKDKILKQKSLVFEIGSGLNIIKSFLIGRDEPQESEGTVKEDCLMDSININTYSLEYILKTVSEIKDILEGEN